MSPSRRAALEGAQWRTASYTQAQGQCVEVAPGHDRVVGIRDSKNRTGGTHTVGLGTWDAFILGIKQDRFQVNQGV